MSRVKPCSLSCRRVCISCLVPAASRLAVGSSHTKTFGFMAYTDAMAALSLIHISYSQTRSNTQRDLMNPDEVLRLENRKCLALFKGHKPALLYKMTPEELPDYAGLTTCRVIDYIPEWRRKEAEAAPQKRPQAPAQKEAPHSPKLPVNEKQPDRSGPPPAYDLAEDDEIGMVECTVESIRGL